MVKRSNWAKDRLVTRQDGLQPPHRQTMQVRYFSLRPAPSNFPSAPKVITSSDLEASQPVIFSELLNRAARAKQATNWGQHLTKYFLPINTCCKPIVRGRWHPQMQVCKSVRGGSSQTTCLCTPPPSGFLPPAMIDLTTSPTLVRGAVGGWSCNNQQIVVML